MDKYPYENDRRLHQRIFFMCLRGSQISQPDRAGTLYSSKCRLKTNSSSTAGEETDYGGSYLTDYVSIAEAVVFELIISVSAEVYLSLLCIKHCDVSINVLVNNKLGLLLYRLCEYFRSGCV